MSAPVITWEERNRAYLLAALARVRRALEHHMRSPDDGPRANVESAASVDDTSAWPDDLPAPALEAICAAFSLSPFERDVLLMCAGVELDSQWPSLIARVAGDDRQAAPTFGLALAVLPQAHWSALAPHRPLRYWRLLDVESHASVTGAPLRIDEAILHVLAGVPTMDERLRAYVEPVGAAPSLPPSQAARASDVVRLWQARGRAPPVIELSGRHAADLRAVAAAACAQLRLTLFGLAATDIPTGPQDREWLSRVWQREAFLHGAALLVTVDERSVEVATSFVESLTGYVFVLGDLAGRCGRPGRVRLAIDSASPEERERLWHDALGSLSASANGSVAVVAAEFDLSQADIEATARTLREESNERAESLDSVDRRLWRAVQSALRTRLDGPAERIVPRAGWADLVLPASQLDLLRLLAAHLRHRRRVYDDWGFGDLSSRGLGISTLFAGPSGTGKTMAAEVLARELSYDLYRIDLSQVVSKYIGETEKNLKRVFDAGESGGAILLFDEADALFGKRSEVRDSHDRYANIEVSYLLQRMEAYRGLAVLTTNMKTALDPSFLRRIRFVVQFPFPDGALRAEIWRRVFPPGTPTDQLDIARLARLNVAGGNIRNIALNAAFLAADAAEPVRMLHLLRAARSEYAKLERPLTDAEIVGWV
jgi:hypothetical protein